MGGPLAPCRAFGRPGHHRGSSFIITNPVKKGTKQALLGRGFSENAGLGLFTVENSISGGRVAGDRGAGVSAGRGLGTSWAGPARPGTVFAPWMPGPGSGMVSVPSSLNPNKEANYATPS